MPDIDPRELMPEWVVLAREARGMSVGDLAGASGVGASTIDSIELGDIDVTAAQINKIADALDVPVSFFLNRNELDVAYRPPHMNCISSEYELALAEERSLRVRLLRIVRGLSAHSLRDALHAVEEVRKAEMDKLCNEPQPPPLPSGKKE